MRKFILVLALGAALPSASVQANPDSGTTSPLSARILALKGSWCSDYDEELKGTVRLDVQVVSPNSFTGLHTYAWKNSANPFQKSVEGKILYNEEIERFDLAYATNDYNVYELYAIGGGLYGYVRDLRYGERIWPIVLTKEFCKTQTPPR